MSQCSFEITSVMCRGTSFFTPPSSSKLHSLTRPLAGKLSLPPGSQFSCNYSSQDFQIWLNGGKKNKKKSFLILHFWLSLYKLRCQLFIFNNRCSFTLPQSYSCLPFAFCLSDSSGVRGLRNNWDGIRRGRQQLNRETE